MRVLSQPKFNGEVAENRVRTVNLSANRTAYRTKETEEAIVLLFSVWRSSLCSDMSALGWPSLFGKSKRFEFSNTNGRQLFCRGIQFYFLIERVDTQGAGSLCFRGLRRPHVCSQRSGRFLAKTQGGKLMITEGEKGSTLMKVRIPQK